VLGRLKGRNDREVIEIFVLSNTRRFGLPSRFEHALRNGA
jgi:hypothetical protein